jgi:hypothetical protein
MQKVSGPQVVTPAEALERPLPAGIQEALGELLTLGQLLDMPERGVSERNARTRLLSRDRLLLHQSEPANQRREE